MKISRRKMMQLIASAAPAVGLSSAFAQDNAAPPATRPAAALPLPPAPTPIAAPPGFGVAPGAFQPTWESLSQWTVPDWYRDAKLGIWAHWGPQCQPEMGDWYAQKMYQSAVRDTTDYKFHCQKYGHPSKFGFKDVINEFKAEKWNPEELVALYKNAGAKYFCAMAVHHDNFDMYDSKYQPWNSVAIGPKKNLVGGWEKAARAAGLKFAISSHGDRAWAWYQDAQKSDTTGPLKGVPYDGQMTRADGKGLWWEGLDPQDLYAQYHPLGQYNWELRGTPAVDPNFIEKFFNRTIDLIDKHQPDLLYFDDTVLPLYPLSDIGLRIAAYLYNTNAARNGGKVDCVLTGKGLNPQQRKSLVLDMERGAAIGGESLPWQTDTCIGSWHYERRVFDRHTYKTPLQVVQMFVDIVSKNGNLMLNIPVRGDGTIDSDELKVVQALGKWMASNGEGIYATRPWDVYGEGPSTEKKPTTSRFGGAADVRPYAAGDVRFTRKGGVVYAFLMTWPEGGKTTIQSLSAGNSKYPGAIAKVEMLGVDGPLKFSRDESGLTVNLPETRPGDFAYALKITPA